MIIHAVTESEWLRGTQEEGGDAQPVTNAYTAAAFSHCTHHLQLSDPQTRFGVSTEPDRSWDLGFGRYMIYATVGIVNPTSSEATRQYICRIHYRSGDLMNFANWEVAGFEFVRR